MEKKKIEDGYVGIYRPSLTDSMIKRNSLSLYQQYALVPPSQPKRRDWCDRAAACNNLHISSQLWSPEQAKFYQVVNEKESSTKRLGMSLSVLQIDKINPVESYWRGIIKFSLYVSDEKWGNNSNTQDPNAEEKLEKDDAEKKLFEDLFENTFGIRFYNMVYDTTNDDHATEILDGPLTWEEMESSKEEKTTTVIDDKKAKDTDEKKKNNVWSQIRQLDHKSIIS